MKKSAKQSFIRTLLLLTATIPWCRLMAQEKPDTLKKYTLKEVVVSATKEPQNPNTTGRSISILSGLVLKRSIYTSVGELLSSQAGITLTGTGLNPGSQQSLFIRGSNSNQSVVMIDGVRISDPSTVDNGIDLSELSVTEASRIEIVRGAHSTLYGSSAIGGVINIITDDHPGKTFFTDINTTAGIFNKNASSFTNNLKLGLKSNNGFYFNTGFHQVSVNGFNATLDTITNPKIYNHPDKDNSSKFDYFTKAGYISKKLNVFVMYKKINQSTDLDKSAFTDDNNRRLTFYRNLVDYGASCHLTPKFSVYYSGGYSNTRRVDLDDSSITGYRGDTAIYDHTYSKTTLTGTYLTNDLYTIFARENFRLITGINLSEEKMNNINYLYSNSPQFGLYESKTDLDSLKLHASILSFYLQAEFNGAIFSDRLRDFTLDLGIRLSEHNKFGSNYTYDINPACKIGNNLLFACFTTGFNAPSLYQLYDPDKSSGAYTTRGNSKLKPETSNNFELGMKCFPNDNLNLTLSLFYSKINNLITYVYLWDKKIPIDSLGSDWMRNDLRGDTYINLSEQEITGIELSVQFQVTTKLRLNANTSLIRGKTILPANSIDTSQTGGNHVQLFESGVFINNKTSEIIGLTRRPGSLANLELVYSPVSKISIGFNNHFVGSRNDSYFNSTIKPYGALSSMLINGYILSDLSVSLSFSKNIYLSLKCTNLFNVNYMEINGFATQKRGLFLKAGYSFER